MIRSVPVDLGERAYEVLIGPGLLDTAGERLRPLVRRDRVAVVSDRTVWGLHGARLTAALGRAGLAVHPIVLPPGEQTKSFAGLESLCDELLALELDRGDLIVAFGGGVIGDLAGFAAAIYKRGADFVQVPTTLLAQVDSSVGGKTAIDTPRGKNLVGAFHQPKLVLCDLDTLGSLPDREFRAGLAEVIKYGIIYDAPFFRRLEKSLDRILARDPAELSAVVARCCAIKADVVGQDETESGLRAILNYGHTIGHGLEAISSYGKYLHGEAISIGQVAASYLSAALLGMPGQDVERVRELFFRAGLPVCVKLSPVQRKALFDAMRLDKKVSAGEIKFVLARAIGRVEFGQSVPDDRVNWVLDRIEG